jgi:hypothetical protein
MKNNSLIMDSENIEKNSLLFRIKLGEFYRLILFCLLRKESRKTYFYYSNKVRHFLKSFLLKNQVQIILIKN